MPTVLNLGIRVMNCFFIHLFIFIKLWFIWNQGWDQIQILELSKNLVVLEKMAEHKILSWEVVVLDAYWTKIRVFT